MKKLIKKQKKFQKKEKLFQKKEKLKVHLMKMTRFQIAKKMMDQKMQLLLPSKILKMLLNPKGL